MRCTRAGPFADGYPFTVFSVSRGGLTEPLACSTNYHSVSGIFRLGMVGVRMDVRLLDGMDGQAGESEQRKFLSAAGTGRAVVSEVGSCSVCICLLAQLQARRVCYCYTCPASHAVTLYTTTVFFNMREEMSRRNPSKQSKRVNG